MPRIDVRDQHVDVAVEAALLGLLKAACTGPLPTGWCPGFLGERAAEFAGLLALADHAHPPGGPGPGDGEGPGGPGGDPSGPVPEAGNRRAVAGILRAAGRRRRAEDVLTRLADGTARLQNVIREDQAGRMVSASGIIGELLADLEKRRAAVKEHGAAAVGIPTGIRRLDTLLGGLQTGLHLLAAEPGAGKTTLALQIAGRAAADGCPCCSCPSING